MMSSDDRPVFVGGENRSGTTLLTVILDSHPSVTVGTDLDFTEPVDLGRHVLEACALVEARDPRVLGPGTDVADQSWYHGSHFVKQADRFGLAPSGLSRLVAEAMTETGSNLVDLRDRCRLVEKIGRHIARAAGSELWGMKLQRRIQRVDDFASFWPGGRFIHIVRDGRDVAASHLRSVPWGFKDVRDIAASWRDTVMLPREGRAAAGPNFMELSYERLVREPETSCRDMASFLGLAWDDRMLRHIDSPHSLHRAPWGHPAAEDVRRPVSGDRVGRYTTDLTADEIGTFEEIAGEALLAHGYELQSSRA